MRLARGFTLIEVLVALAIIAIALGAALRATSSAADNTLALEERTLARWVGENELARLRTLPALPPNGIREGNAQQGEGRFVFQASVEETPNPNFRRVHVRVRREQSENFIADVQGYLVAKR